MGTQEFQPEILPSTSCPMLGTSPTRSRSRKRSSKRKESSWDLGPFRACFLVLNGELATWGVFFGLDVTSVYIYYIVYIYSIYIVYI